MPQRLKWTTSKTDENEFSSLSEMLKIDFRNMAKAHLASQESELVMQSYGMSSYWWNVIHDKKKEIENTVNKLESLNKEFDEMCAPFGGIDKVEEIFKNVDEVEANFTCSDAYLDYFISHQEEVDKAHKEKLKNFKIVDGIPEVECPNCRALSPLTVTKCPNCGMQFENGV